MITHYCYLTYFGLHVLVFVNVILYFFLTLNCFLIALIDNYFLSGAFLQLLLTI